MASIGEILEWKFDAHSGMTVVEGKITEWPKELGEIPTDEQIKEWGADFEIYRTGLLAKENLAEIDAKSIRSLREWITGQNGCPEILKTHESNAVTERNKIK